MWRSSSRTRATSTRSITSPCSRIQQEQFAEGLKVIPARSISSPSQARLHNLKGQAHLRQNQDDDALHELRPRHRGRSGVRRRLRQPRHAALRDGPRGGGARRLRPRAGAAAEQSRGPLQPGQRAGRSRPLDEALQGFTRAIALMPALAPAYFNRADVLLRLGRPAEALRDYDRAIALYPEIAAAHSQPRARAEGARPARRGAGKRRCGDQRDAEFARRMPAAARCWRRWTRRRGEGEPERAAALNPKYAAPANALAQRRQAPPPPPASRRSDRRGAPGSPRRAPRTACSSPRRHAPRSTPRRS